MPRFSKEDLKPNYTKLNVIINKLLNQPILKDYQKYDEWNKRRFDKTLTTYINNLPEEDWDKILFDDFAEIINCDIFNENMKPENYRVKELNDSKTILLTKEQLEFHEKTRIEKGETEIIF
jgi:hypothetical protein